MLPNCSFIESASVKQLKTTMSPSWETVLQMVLQSPTCRTFVWKINASDCQFSNEIHTADARLISFAECHKILCEHRDNLCSINVQSRAQICAIVNDPDSVRIDLASGLECEFNSGKMFLAIQSWDADVFNVSLPKVYSFVKNGVDFLNDYSPAVSIGAVFKFNGLILKFIGCLLYVSR